MQLKDKVAIVTGSGRGIGAGIADALAKEGAILIVMDRNMADAQSEAKKIESAGGRAMAVEGDVTKKATLDAMVAAVLQKYGRIDILVNNAGIESVPMLLKDISEAQWDRTLGVNLKGVFSLLPGGHPADDQAEQRTNHQYLIAGRTPHELLRQRRLYGLQVGNGAVSARTWPGNWLTATSR